MLNTIIFSKDRPLQLTACLESLFYNSDIKEMIYVITPSLASPGYDQVAREFPQVIFIEETRFGGFFNALSSVSHNSEKDDYTLLLVDDTICIRQFNTHSALSLLEEHQDVFGFSLRLGPNINFCPGNEIQSNLAFKWSWLNKPSHYGYPFDVSASIYKDKYINAILNYLGANITSPNHLESSGVNLAYKNPELFPKYNMSFNSHSCIVMQDVNRVQDAFPNKHGGTSLHTPATLLNTYLAGGRIDWTRLNNIVPTDCFVGSKYFALI